MRVSRCTTGTRSSALLILWLAKYAGHNLEAALKVAEDMKFLRRLMDSGWVHEWLLPELPLGTDKRLATVRRASTGLAKPSGYLFLGLI